LGLLNAWWDADGTRQFLWILAPLLLAALTFSDLKKRFRAFIAVLSLLMPLVIPPLLPASRPFATLDWVVISVLCIFVAYGLASSHYRQVRSSVKAFYDHFNKTKRGSKPKKEELVAEGASSFKVLIFGIYGLAALLGSITSYVYIGVTRRPEGFIYQNNEGFMAGASLLIIVLAGAAVPIYTELAKQVRTGIDLYETQISSLHLAATNAGHHADFLWTHFERVARSTIRSWSSTINIQSAAQANHLMLFMPFLALRDLRARDANMRTIEKIRDELFTQYLEFELEQTPYVRQGNPEIDFHAQMPGADLHYFAEVDTEASLDRVLLFLNTRSDLDESGETVTEQDLDLLGRRHRARRLKYLGWSLQGDLAVAQARTGVSGVLRCNQNQATPIVLQELLPNQMRDSWEFLNSAMYLVPATEELFVAFLTFQEEYDTTSPDQTTPTLIHLAQLEFNRRAQRHLHQWSALDNTSGSASLSQNLATCGDPLDIDVSTLSDDIALFHHLFIATKPGMNQGADARFLYYCFWLIALQNAQTRVSQVVGAGRYDGMEPRELLQKLLVDFKQLFTIQYRKEMTTEKEFLLLSLADHKSALYNWLRAAKAVTTRQKLSEYESRLDGVTIETQLGLEVIPRLRDRLNHLRQYIGINESQKPLTVRSVYDLLPVASTELRKRIRLRRVFRDSYIGGYRRVVEFLNISRSFSDGVGIETRVCENIFDIDARDQWRNAIGVNLDDRTSRFLNWILRCFEEDIREEFPADNLLVPLGNDNPNFQLIIKALWCVSPAYRNEVRQCDTPATERTEITDRELNDSMQRTLRQISQYCLDRANEDDMKNTFFGGQDPATRNQAGGQYNAWRERFEQRDIRNEEGN